MTVRDCRVLPRIKGKLECRRECEGGEEERRDEVVQKIRTTQHNNGGDEMGSDESLGREGDALTERLAMDERESKLQESSAAICEYAMCCLCRTLLVDGVVV